VLAVVVKSVPFVTAYFSYEMTDNICRFRDFIC